MRNLGKALLGLVLHQEGAKTSNRCTRSLLTKRQAGLLNGGKSRSGLVGLPAPLVVFCAGIMHSTLLLLLAGSHLKGGSWVLAFSYLIVYNLPQLLMHIFLAPQSFFVFCCSRRRLSRCKYCSKGSQVSGPSLSQGEEPIFHYFTCGGLSELGS